MTILSSEKPQNESGAILILKKMPQNCWDCPICYDFIECLGADGRRTEMLDVDTDERPEWCPLIMAAGAGGFHG